MKINELRSGKDGAVLLTTVCILTVLTLMAVSYLFLLKDNNYLVARDQAWNRALVISEAGIEEGMAHINSLGPSSAQPPYSSDGWSASGTNYVTPSARTGLYGGSYNVLVGGGFLSATITSTGMVSAPISGGTISRIVQVTATRKSVYQVAIAALLGINMNGNNITVDSYDSSDTNHFTNGLWNATWRRDHGDVATLEDSGSALQLGNANIMGKLHSGPGGTVQQAVNALGPQGSVGDVPYVTGGSTGIETPQTNWFADDMNVVFPDVTVPYTSGQSVPAATSPGGNTNLITLSTQSYYVNGDLNIPNKTTLAVAPFSYATLYVTGSFSMTSQANINVPWGSQLILYVGSTNTSTTTSDTFTAVNNGGNANSFQLYGLPNVTQLKWQGNAQYIGTVYAPEAKFTLGGGGSTATDYQGACVVQSVTIGGHFNVHYDENLARATNALFFYASSWQELYNQN
jgi:hypothetical protein